MSRMYDNEQRALHIGDKVRTIGGGPVQIVQDLRVYLNGPGNGIEPWHLVHVDGDFKEPIKDVTLTVTQGAITAVCNELLEFLLDKNRKYGDSAINPIRIFSKANSVEQINVRIDDKINRMRNQQEDEDEDVTKDLAGYLILKMVAQKLHKDAGSPVQE